MQPKADQKEDDAAQARKPHDGERPYEGGRHGDQERQANPATPPQERREAKGPPQEPRQAKGAPANPPREPPVKAEEA